MFRPARRPADFRAMAGGSTCSSGRKRYRRQRRPLFVAVSCGAPPLNATSFVSVNFLPSGLLAAPPGKPNGWAGGPECDAHLVINGWVELHGFWRHNQRRLGSEPTIVRKFQCAGTSRNVHLHPDLRHGS